MIRSRRVQISTDRQVFETIRATNENMLQDAIYGPVSISTPHLLFHWQQRPENEAHRFGHFSFLTPAVEGGVWVARSVSRVEVTGAAQDLSVCLGARNVF